MSLQVALNAVTFLYSQDQKEEEWTQFWQHLLLSLNRELSFNAEPLAEAKKLSAESSDLARDLALKTKTDMFDAVRAFGVSIKVILGNENLNQFSQNSGIAVLVAGKYSARLRNVTTKPIFIEYAYHRLKVMKVYAKTGLPRNADGLEYFCTLMQAAKLVSAFGNWAFPSNL